MKQELVNTTSDAMQIAQAFFSSGMFQDIKSANQALVKIVLGKELGISPAASMNGIHIIAGKPVIGAGLMASRVRSFGKYDYKILEHSDSICSIEYFMHGKSLGISTFTLEDAKRAGTKNLEKFPRNMLFARAMSNGVKWFTPDIYEQPVYVPEEMELMEIPKPQMTDIQFMKAIAKINEGDLEVIDKTLEHFTITKEQHEMMSALINEQPKTFE